MCLLTTATTDHQSHGGPNDWNSWTWPFKSILVEIFYFKQFTLLNRRTRVKSLLREVWRTHVHKNGTLVSLPMSEFFFNLACVVSWRLTLLLEHFEEDAPTSPCVSPRISQHHEVMRVLSLRNKRWSVEFQDCSFKIASSNIKTCWCTRCEPISTWWYEK